ncbi:MAG: hypothetical protein EHM23_14420 [Acidobacteria bacterium]|nr:MAG: hypothetical protein EHM23_14420 [Acidobacteriota bacterium]
MLKARVAFSFLSAVALLHPSFHELLAESNHVVTPGELRNELVKHSSNRQTSLGSLERLFSRPEVARTLEKTVGSPKKIMQAAAVLSDDELARLAEKALRIEADFAAGALSNQELTYIVIALGTAVLILVIIVAGD